MSKKIKVILYKSEVSKQLLKGPQLDNLLQQKYREVNQTDFENDIFEGQYRKVAGHKNQKPITEELAKKFMKSGTEKQKRLARRWYAENKK